MKRIILLLKSPKWHVHSLPTLINASSISISTRSHMPLIDLPMNIHSLALTVIQKFNNLESFEQGSASHKHLLHYSLKSFTHSNFFPGQVLKSEITTSTSEPAAGSRVHFSNSFLNHLDGLRPKTRRTWETKRVTDCH